jgi:putative hydrolase of the HAD superfamily
MAVTSAIIFDLDDTLIAEEDFVESGYRAVAEMLADAKGISLESAMAAMVNARAVDPRRVFDVACAALGVGAATVEACIETYRYHSPAIAPTDDARFALDWARAKGAIALLSDGDARTQRLKLTACRLSSYFDVTVLTGELPQGQQKPSTAGYELIMRGLNLDAAGRVVCVADNPLKDFIGPRTMGMRTVRIARPNGVYLDATAPAGGDPDATISSLFELPEVISTFGL